MTIRGTWQTPRFTKWDIIFVLVSLFPLAMIRAATYVTSDDGSDVYYLVEKTMPLNWWGWFIVILLSVLAVGLILSNHILIWMGHSLMALNNFTLMVGIFLGYVFGEADLFLTLTYLSFLITPLVLHFLFSIRMGSRPIDEEEDSHVTESVVGQDG